MKRAELFVEIQREPVDPDGRVSGCRLARIPGDGGRRRRLVGRTPRVHASRGLRRHAAHLPVRPRVARHEQPRDRSPSFPDLRPAPAPSARPHRRHRGVRGQAHAAAFAVQPHRVVTLVRRRVQAGHGEVRRVHVGHCASVGSAGKVGREDLAPRRTERDEDDDEKRDEDRERDARSCRPRRRGHRPLAAPPSMAGLLRIGHEARARAPPASVRAGDEVILS